MSVTYIPAALRRQVIARARGRCEYCRIPEDATINGCEVDHVIAEKHNGATIAENLSHACFFCNRNKGSDLGSHKPGTQEFVRFYNPRTDDWDTHFRVADGITIIPLTDTARRRYESSASTPPTVCRSDKYSAIWKWRFRPTATQ